MRYLVGLAEVARNFNCDEITEFAEFCQKIQRLTTSGLIVSTINRESATNHFRSSGLFTSQSDLDVASALGLEMFEEGVSILRILALRYEELLTVYALEKPGYLFRPSVRRACHDLELLFNTVSRST